MMNLKKLSLVLVLSILLASVGWTGNKDEVGIMEGRVDFITSHALYINGMQYPISRDVEVILYSEDGPKITLETITGVGFIDRAIVYVKNGFVIKIVIQEVSQ